jgi:excisionase family DNA binding protein
MRVQAPGDDGLRELASGVDALYLSGHGYLSKAFLARLEEERIFADRVAVPVPFELGPLTLGLAPHGWGKYRYCLDHEIGRIGFTSSRRLPSVRIQPRAELLHSVGPEETVRHFADLVRPFVDGLVLSVARLDLFVDMEGMQLCAHDRSAFVCRGDGCTTYENDNVVTGFAIGSRRTQHVSARLYDKTAEMALKGNDWWELVWGERHTPGAQVWRIEFEIGRAALSELELFLPEAVLAAVPSLWAHCAGNWLTLRSPTPGLESVPMASRPTLGGRAVGVTQPRGHRVAVHPGAQARHRPSQAHARPRRIPRRLRRGEGDHRHRRHLRRALGRRGQRRDRSPHDIRRACPPPSSRKRVPVSTERDDTTTGIEREGGRRRAPDGEGRPKGRALAGRPPRSAKRSLRCAECGELRPSSALLTMDQVAFRLGTSLRHMRRLVAERRIPVVKVGHLVRFDRHDIEHWVDDHRVDVVVPAAVAIRAARMQRRLEREHRRAG